MTAIAAMTGSPLRNDALEALGPAAGEASLDEALSRPGPALPLLLESFQGDLAVLGAGGKMGPSLARMARRALDAAGAEAAKRRVYAVSRFSGAAGDALMEELREAGLHVVRADLTNRAAVDALPDAANVVFMAGQKFGTGGEPALTWAMNAWVPALCAERYATSRTVVFSTGNVYALTSLDGGGSRETDPPSPVGEYAMSCLARERLYEFFATKHHMQSVILRLNYANALRYGVLTDIARRIVAGDAVDVTMGAVNVIWQGDANRLALTALAHAAEPPLIVNVTGRERLPVRTLAHELGRRLGRAPVIAGREAPDALLSDTARMHELLGAPETTVADMLDWTAAWIGRGGTLLEKPTRFEVRDGGF